MSELPKAEEKKPEVKPETKPVEQTQTTGPQTMAQPAPQIGIGIPPVTVNLSMPITKSESTQSKPAQPAQQAQSYKAIVITDTCKFCEGIEEYIAEQGLTDKVKIINASTPEGRRFAIQHGIRGVPECVVVEGPEGKQVKVCSKEEFVKLLKEGS